MSNSNHKNEPVMFLGNAVIEEGCRIGQDVTVGNFSILKKDAEIGNKTKIGQNVIIPEGVIIGKNCEIQNNVCFNSGVICEEEVFIGHGAVFTNVYFPHQHIMVNHKRAKMDTKIQQGVKIGANSTIVCGVVIGRYAFIAAGSIISNDVKPYALVSGNPAKQIGWMSEYGSKMNFHNKTRTSICSISGHSYKLDHNGVRRIS
ncbi:MAG: N-acetyltransferase [Ferruginibacter sp.]|nr:N-acetyltransferase [Ferruginibacter sp.]